MQQEKAILVVSFGTSHEDTRKKTIEKIEENIAAAYPEYRLYRAWTSNMIRRKLEKRDGMHIDSVDEALKRMKQDGIRQVIVQPTHVLSGIENDRMLESLRAAREDFEELRIGSSLLATERDIAEAAAVLGNQWAGLSENEAVVLMGHGTEHEANATYAKLNEVFCENGSDHIFIATVEGTPTLENAISEIGKRHPKKVYLQPFMVVAGDHAKNDMAGEDDDSWRSRFEKEGYDVQCEIIGLGELPEIREMFVRHVREAV